MAGQGGEINEYLIGVEVLGRPADYYPGEDATVRNRAYALRNKLQEFYVHEKPDARIRIELPKGSYCPHFIECETPALESIGTEQRNEAPPIAVALEAPLPDAQPRRRVRRVRQVRHVRQVRQVRWIAAASLAIVALAAIAFLLVKNGPHKSALDEFWGPVLESQQPALIYLGKTVTYNLSRRLHDEYLRQNPDKLNASPYVLPLAPGTQISPADIIPVPHINVGAGDAVAAVQLTSLFNLRGKATRLRIGIDTSFSDLRDSPVVLLGAFSNTWTMQMTREFRFVFEKELDAGGAVWRVKDRQNPEQWKWSLHNVYPAVKTDTDYAIISRVLNSPSGNTLISAAGITTFGTQAAGEFLTNPAYLDEFMRQAPAGWQKKNLQIVVSVKVIDNTPGPPTLLAVHFW